MKTCTKCEEIKPKSEFYADKRHGDGLCSWCKACHRADGLERKRLNREEDIRCRRAYNAAHRKERRESSKKYRTENKEKIAEWQRDYREKMSLATKAYREVQKALKSGELTQGACEGCDSKAGTDAHHDDYSKPLKVRWLCRPCHQRLHSKQRGYVPKAM